MDAETEFFLRKLEFDYGNKGAMAELKKLSRKVKWLAGWPRDKAAFWNGEAFMWGNKLSQKKRELIRDELRLLGKKGKKNLDLGCGSYSYLKSVGLDISEKMLLLNGNLTEKIRGDLEEKLPFKGGEFDSASLVFVLDYVGKYRPLLNEIFRVLKKRGKLAVVQSGGGVNKWPGQKAVNQLGFRKWLRVLESAGFKIKFYKKGGLWFFKGEKSKII